MDTNTGSASNQTAGSKSFTRFFPPIARVLMGLAFLFFGIMGFTAKPPANLPENIKMVNDGLMAGGYTYVALGTMVLVGVLLLINRFVPLALAFIAPILVGILTFHIATSLSMIVPGAVLSLIELYLAWSYRKVFCPMLAAKVSPGGNCG
ncbi:MAG TPA: DoxX family protein [Verrucomicrobiae bacterium]|jgi:uncharacterized membrane protein YphA (DoxX/SURF4 family)|nr:DoxX family protein [Verrucomicrobiae bacterium]